MHFLVGMEIVVRRGRPHRRHAVLRVEETPKAERRGKTDDDDDSNINEDNNNRDNGGNIVHVCVHNVLCGTWEWGPPPKMSHKLMAYKSTTHTV